MKFKDQCSIRTGNEESHVAHSYGPQNLHGFWSYFSWGFQPLSALFYTCSCLCLDAAPVSAPLIKTLIPNGSFIPVQIATAFLCCHLPKDVRYSFYPQASIFCLYNPNWSHFFFVSCVSWLGIRALPSVARGLPDWLESFRGKRAERFWGLEIWVWNIGWCGPRFQPKIYTLKNLLTPARAQSLIFARFEGSASQGCKTAVCRWVIAPGLGIQPRNCTVRIWKLARLNSADVTASAVYGRTEFDPFLAIKCLISSSY